MAELRVIARVIAREGRAEELQGLLRGMVAPTRAEVGCRFYELFASNNIPRLFYINELWESQAHLEAHVVTPHFVEIFGKAQALLAGPLEVNLLTEVK